MTYGYENLKLEKGMYAQSGKSFSKVLESMDPSENYRGTALEGLDAFQRQLKRFDIHVKGAGSDMVEKFFHTTGQRGAVPRVRFARGASGHGERYSARDHRDHDQLRRHGLPHHRVRADGRRQGAAPRGGGRGPSDDRHPHAGESGEAPQARTYARGESYEAIRFQRLDLFSVTLRQIGAYIGRQHLQDAVEVLLNGDGNDNAADAYEIGSGSGKISGTAGTLTYSALLEFWSSSTPTA